jgi:hypothetical protein
MRRGTQEAPKAPDMKRNDEAVRVGTRKGEEPGHGVSSGGRVDQGTIR